MRRKVDFDNRLSGAVIAAAIAVHRELGPGLDEPHYQEALSRLAESVKAGMLSRMEYLDERHRINSVRQVALSILWSGYSRHHDCKRCCS